MNEQEPVSDSKGQSRLDPPWARAKAHRRSQRQEERLGGSPGGRKQINSGRFWHSKRDARVNEFLIEARETQADSYRLSESEFDRVEKDAYATPPGCLPAMQIDFKRRSVIVLRLDDHEEREALIASLKARIESLESE